MTIKIIVIIWLCVLAFILYIGYKSAKIKKKNDQIYRDNLNRIDRKREFNFYNHEDDM